MAISQKSLDNIKAKLRQDVKNLPAAKKMEELKKTCDEFEDYFAKITEKIEKMMEESFKGFQNEIDAEKTKILAAIDTGKATIRGENRAKAKNGELYNRIENGLGYKKFVIQHDAGVYTLEYTEPIDPASQAPEQTESGACATCG